jgi:uncharacterized glyoxalase superfamily protein PhnB
MSRPTPMICISLRYAEAPKMFGWLTEALGFKRLAAHYSEDGKTLLHAQLRMGESVMLL